MRTLLVTGAAGFIGSNFVRHWTEHHPDDRIVALDALTYAGSKLNLTDVGEGEHFRFVEGDIRDRDLLDRLFADEDPDTVVHLAAESHVDRSIDGPDVFLHTNVLGTHELLKAARRHWAMDAERSRRFHHVSTDEVFGSLSEDAAASREGDPYAPNSPYSASKAAADHLVRAYGRTYGLPVSSSHCTNNFGPFQHPEKFIPVIVLSALQERGIPVYGDGRNIRDWLFVDDHCAALAAILDQGSVGHTYNVSSGTGLRNLDVAERICGILDECHPRPQGGYRDLITLVEDRPGHDRRYALDSSVLREELGWAPSRSFDAALRATVDWYLDNIRWCENVAAAGAGETP